MGRIEEMKQEELVGSELLKSSEDFKKLKLRISYLEEELLKARTIIEYLEIKGK